MAAVLGQSGAPGPEAIDLVRRLRSALSQHLPPPTAFVGDRLLEARWWWAQSLAVVNDAISFFVQGLGDQWLEAVSRAIDLAGRAVSTCPMGAPDLVAMARSAADIVLDACEAAPLLVGPQLAQILATVEHHCSLLPPTEAAPRRVRALPLMMAAGGSAATALIILDEARTLLRGQPIPVPVSRAARSMARMLAVLGDGPRALVLLEEVEAGIEFALNGHAAPARPPWLDAALMEVRAGRVAPPVDFDALTGPERREAQAALSVTGDLAFERMALLVDRAMSLLDLGRATEAEEHFTRVLDSMLQAAPILRAQAEMYRGIARLESGDVDRAAADIEAAVAAAGGESPLGWPVIAYARARISALRNLPETDHAFDFATRLTDGTGIGWRTWAARALHQVQTSPADAIESYRNMATEIVRLRRSTLGYRLDSTSLQDKVPHIAAAVRLAADKGDWRTTLELIETFKARQLQAVLADRTAGVGPPADRLAAVDRRIDAIEFAGVESIDERAKTMELATLRAERIVLLERDEWQQSASAGLLPATSAPVERILHGAVLAGQVAVDLHLDLPTRRLTGVGFRDGAGVVGAVDLLPSTIDAILRRAANLQSAAPDSLLYDPQRAPTLSLDQILSPGLLDLLDGASQVIISSHGPLHLMPWPAMRWGEKRLLDTTAVSLVPSLWSLALLGPAPAAPTGVVCFGAPEGNSMPALGAIPGAATELQAIKDAYAAIGRSAIATVGPQATEAAFRRLLEQPVEPGTVLHLACHAVTGSDGYVAGRPFLDGPEDPLAAGFVFGDSVLDADELRRIRMPFAEAVLGACSTGWRPTTVGDVELAADSALGLVASFLQAGATSIIASVPKVYDDAAPILLRRYHQQRIAGRSPASALCTAQSELLAEANLDAPTIVGFATYGRG